jgi:hypothetical protein
MFRDVCEDTPDTQLLNSFETIERAPVLLSALLCTASLYFPLLDKKLNVRILVNEPLR